MMDAKDLFLVEQFHHAFPFYLYAIFCVALVPETGGKSLEEIERQWKRNNAKAVTGPARPQ